MDGLEIGQAEVTI